MTYRLRDIIWPAKPQPAQSRKIAFNRLRFGMAAVALCLVAISGKALYLSTSPDLRSHHATAQKGVVQRGAIIDRTGKRLATSVPRCVCCMPTQSSS